MKLSPILSLKMDLQKINTMISELHLKEGFLTMSRAWVEGIPKSIMGKSLNTFGFCS